MRKFRFTGKRKNPATYCDVRIGSDRFDNEPDNCKIYIWAGEKTKAFVYGLFE